MGRGVKGGGVGMCMFSMRRIDLELALIDHILFPFSVALPPPFPHQHAQHAHPPARLGHLPGLGGPADARSARFINV